MFVRSDDDVRGTARDVWWGNGTSLRLLTESDKMGFTICRTVVRAGTLSRLAYKNHLEACYCIAGLGYVEDVRTGVTHDIRPGTLYVLDQHDEHLLGAAASEDMILISVFNPPLVGTEAHSTDSGEPSSY